MVEQKKKYRTSKIKSFFFFLFVATIFWMLTKFSNESTGTVTANLAFFNVPPTVSISDRNQKNVSFDIQANGFQFLSYQFKKPTIDINIAEYYEENDSLLLISSSEFGKIIASQLGNDTRVINVSLDELGIVLDKLTTKKVPVVFASQIDYKDGFRNLNKPIIVPDSVIISGPSSEVSDTDLVITSQYLEKNISEDISKILPLVIPEETNLILTPNKVKVTLNVEEFTEKRLTIPIELINVPEGIALKLLPEVVQITFNVSVGSFNDITESDFQVVCDYNIKTSDATFMTPKLIKQPTGIHNVELGTKRIEFLIFK